MCAVIEEVGSFLVSRLSLTFFPGLLGEDPLQPIFWCLSPAGFQPHFSGVTFAFAQHVPQIVDLIPPPAAA